MKFRTCQPQFFYSTFDFSDGSLPFSVAPARSYDNRPIAYMVNSSTNGGNSLTLWTLDTTDPTVITGTYGPVSTNSYSMPPNAQQAGTSALITTWDPRIFNAVYQPDSGLWTAHTTGCTPAGDTTERACVQWYQMDPASFTVQQQGLVQLPGWYFYSAAIAANDEGDAVLGFTGSNANQYAGIYLTGRYHTDPPNTVQTILQVKAGEGCYQTNDGLNSVSTHSDATVDPIDSTVFWTHTAFAYGKDASCQNNDWATGIAAVQFVGGTAVSNGATSSSKANGTLARPRRRLQVLSHFGG